MDTGQLAKTLSVTVKFASKHVYECGLCSQKGFICEICSNPKVIYPFETSSTVKVSNICDELNFDLLKPTNSLDVAHCEVVCLWLMADTWQNRVQLAT